MDPAMRRQNGWLSQSRATWRRQFRSVRIAASMTASGKVTTRITAPYCLPTSPPASVGLINEYYLVAWRGGGFRHGHLPPDMTVRKTFLWTY